MDGITEASYRLSDRYLEDYLEQHESDSGDAPSQNLYTVRGGTQQRPTTGNDTLVDPLRRVEKHESWVGLSTGPTVWALTNLYRRKSEVPQPVKALQEKYDFVMVRFGVHLDPRKGERFEELTFRAQYAPDSGCFTYDQLPSTRLETLAAAHNKVDFGIKADLSFGAQLPPLPTPTPISVKAEADVKAGVDSSIILNLDFEWKVQEVVSYGPDRQEAQWRMHTKDLVGFVPLYAIIRVPKGAAGLSCTVQAEYVIDMPGWFRGKPEYETDPAPVVLEFAGATRLG